MEGDRHSHGMDMAPDYEIPSIAPDSSYFTHDGYSNAIIAHITLMSLAWVFALPISVMVSIARSRFTSLSQFIFLALNTLGLLFGVIYNANTPNLYANNAHHKVGWIAIWLVSAHTVVGLVRAYAQQSRGRVEHHTIHYERIQEPCTPTEYRWSHDSGQGTEPNSPRTSCASTPGADERNEALRMHQDGESNDADEEKHGLLGNNVVDRYLVQKLKKLSSSRTVRWVSVLYDVTDRLILILGFIVLSTGIVTYGGHFKAEQVFSGLAHFIKGGIFFWYGLLCLGRVMGSFSDLGWSWNVKPPASLVGSRRAAAPSAEFVESLLIFIYGSTNVFLEHLGSSDGKWTAGDLEHIAITVMFFGGGLCGMLIESKRIRDLLNSSFAPYTDARDFGQPMGSLHEPRTYGFSTNPMPAIIILLLGIMMSSHTQISPTSTMMHKLWGTLFLGAALARSVTYILVYLAPPTSYLPSRPPSEIVVAFCLISGGLLFMGSASDIITSMEMYGMHAMVLFTIMMGFTAFLMGWEIIVLAIKGWAVRYEQRRPVLTAA